MLDKPIILCVPDEDTLLPDRLRRVADHVVIGSPGDENTRVSLMNAITMVRETLDDE